MSLPFENGNSAINRFVLVFKSKSKYYIAQLHPDQVTDNSVDYYTCYVLDSDNVIRKFSIDTKKCMIISNGNYKKGFELAKYFLSPIPLTAFRIIITCLQRNIDIDLETVLAASTKLVGEPYDDLKCLTCLKSIIMPSEAYANVTNPYDSMISTKKQNKDGNEISVLVNSNDSTIASTYASQNIVTNKDIAVSTAPYATIPSVLSNNSDKESTKRSTKKKDNSTSNSKRNLNYDTVQPRVSKRLAQNHIRDEEEKCAACQLALDFYPYYNICSKCKKIFHKKCTWGNFFLSDGLNDWLCDSCLCNERIYIFDILIQKWRLVMVDQFLNPTHIIFYEDTRDYCEVHLSDYRVITSENAELLSEECFSKPNIEDFYLHKTLTFKSLCTVDEHHAIEHIYMRRYHDKQYIECLVKFHSFTPLQACWIPQYSIASKYDNILEEYLHSYGLKSNVWKRYISRKEDIYYRTEWSPFIIPDFQILSLQEEQTNCYICKTNKDPERLLLCDRCDTEYHIYCLNPPLTEVPEENWLCPECQKNSKNTGCYPRDGSYMILFKNGDRSRYNSYLLSKFPCGIEMIQRYRREDIRVQDKNSWEVGEEPRPSLLKPPTFVETQNYIFNGDELHANQYILLKEQVPLVYRLLQSVYAYKHSVFVYEHNTYHKTILSAMFQLLLTRNIIGEPILIVCDENQLTIWEQILHQWTTLKVDVFSSNVTIRKEQWMFHVGSASEPVVCDADVLLLDEKQFRKKSSVDATYISNILWSFIVLDNYIKSSNEKDFMDVYSQKIDNLSYEHFILAVHASHVSPSIVVDNSSLQRENSSCVNMKLLKNIVIMNPNDQVPNKTDSLVTHSVSRAKEMETWKNYIHNTRSSQADKDVESVFPCITIARSSMFNKYGTFTEYMLPCILTQIQIYSIRCIYERWYTLLKKNVYSKNDEENFLVLYNEIIKAYNHPFQLGGIQELILQEQRDKTWEESFNFVSGKVQFTSAIINILQKQRIKYVILYSRDVQMVKYLYRYYSNLYPSCKLLYGANSLEMYHRLVNDIKEADSFTLIILGNVYLPVTISLDFVNNVILYDNDIDPKLDIEALKNSFNLGTHSNVIVYRLATVGTLETLIFDPKLQLHNAYEKLLSGNITQLKDLILKSIQCMYSESYKNYENTCQMKFKDKAITIFSISQQTHLFDSNSYETIKSHFPLFVHNPGDNVDIASFDLPSASIQILLNSIWNAKSIKDFAFAYNFFVSNMEPAFFDETLPLSEIKYEGNSLLALQLYEFVMSQFLLYLYPFLPSNLSVEENTKIRKTLRSYVHQGIIKNKDPSENAYYWSFVLKTALYRTRQILSPKVNTLIPYSDIFEELYFSL